MARPEAPASPLSSSTAVRGSLSTAERKRKRRERLAARRAGRAGVGFAAAPVIEPPRGGVSEGTSHPASESWRGPTPRSQTTRGSLLTHVSRLLPVELLAGARPRADGLGECEEEEKEEEIGGEGKDERYISRRSGPDTADARLMARGRNCMLPASDGRDMLCAEAPARGEARQRDLGQAGRLASTPRVEQWRRATEAWTAARLRALGWPHPGSREDVVGSAAADLGFASKALLSLYPTSSTARSVESKCGALRTEWDPGAGPDSRWRGAVVVTLVCAPSEAAAPGIRVREAVLTAVTVRHGVLAASAERVDAASDTWGAAAVVAVLAHDALRTLSLHALPGAQERARVVLSPAPVSGVALRPGSAGNEVLLFGDGLLEVATVRSFGAGLAVEPGVSPLCDVARSAVDMGTRGSHQLAMSAVWVSEDLAAVVTEDGSLWLVGPPGRMRVVETGLPYAVSALPSAAPRAPPPAAERTAPPPPQTKEEKSITWRVLGSVTAHAGPVTALSVWRAGSTRRGASGEEEVDAVVATGGMDGAACAFGLVFGREQGTGSDRTYVAAVRLVAGGVRPGSQERGPGEVGDLDTLRQWLEREMSGRESLLPHFRRRRATLAARAWAALVAEAVAHCDRATARVQHALRDTADFLASRRVLRPAALERIARALHTAAVVEERERAGVDTALAPWLRGVAARAAASRASVHWLQHGIGRLASVGVEVEEDSGLGWAWQQSSVDAVSGLCTAARGHSGHVDGASAAPASAPAGAGGGEGGGAGVGLGPAHPPSWEGRSAGGARSELNVAATARVACARPVSAAPAPDEPDEGCGAVEGAADRHRFRERSAVPRLVPRGHAAGNGPGAAGVADVAVHPDGVHWVSVGGDSVARVWASDDGGPRLLWSLSLPGPAHACALGGGGPSLAVAATRPGDQVPMLLLMDWHQRGRLVDAVSPAGLDGPVQALAVSWDGSLVVAAAQSGDAVVLALQESQLRPIVVMPVPGGAVARHGISLSLNHALCRVRGAGSEAVATYDPVSGAPVPAASAAEGQVWASWRNAGDAALALGADVADWAQRHGVGGGSCGACWRVHWGGRERVVVAAGTDTGLVVLGMGQWRPARTPEAVAQMTGGDAPSGDGSGLHVLVERATARCVKVQCVRVGPANCAVRAVALGGAGPRLVLVSAAAGCDLVTASLDLSEGTGTSAGKGAGDGMHTTLTAVPFHGGTLDTPSQRPSGIWWSERPSATFAIPRVQDVSRRGGRLPGRRDSWVGAVVQPWGGPSFALQCPRRPEIGIGDPQEAAGESARCAAPLATGSACCVVSTRSMVASLWLDGAAWRIRARDAMGGRLLLSEDWEASSAEVEAAAEGGRTTDRVFLSVSARLRGGDSRAVRVVQCVVELRDPEALVTRVVREWVLGPLGEVSSMLQKWAYSQVSPTLT